MTHAHFVAMTYADWATIVAFALIVASNVTTCCCFFLVFYARYRVMNWLHRFSYLAIVAGLSINVLLFFIGAHAPNVGEIVASLGWATLGFVAVERHSAEILRMMRISFWI